jgi:SAM-dependent methyltransferase
MTLLQKMKELCCSFEKCLKNRKRNQEEPANFLPAGVTQEAPQQVAPANFRPLDASPEILQKDLDYALLGGHIYLAILAGEFLRGKKVLEIGPGPNFGLPLILACHGAEVMVADRFLTPWDPDYHPKFYRLLRDSLKTNWALVDYAPLDQILFQGQYSPGSISLCSCSLEELSIVPDQSIDVVISNAVLEHLYDLPLAFSHLARITKPGGLGIHQVDFRDHRDFSHPLDHLLLEDEEFCQEFTQRQGECGNRYRPAEMKQLFDLAGFEVRIFQPNLFTDDEYLREFIGRLRQAGSSRYRDYAADDLRAISGLFLTVRRPLEI